MGVRCVGVRCVELVFEQSLGVYTFNCLSIALFVGLRVVSRDTYLTGHSVHIGTCSKHFIVVMCMQM